MEGEMEHSLSRIWITAPHLITALGFTPEENWQAMREGRCGVMRHEGEPFPCARIDDSRLHALSADAGLSSFHRLEQLFILSLNESIRKSGIDPASPDLLLVIASTKGNIGCYNPEEGFTTDAYLHTMASRIAKAIGSINNPLVVSNACISGVSSLIVASRLLIAGKYKHILVAGGDLLSRFVTTGFASFKSLSNEVCRPYDSSHDGLSLGEACGSLLLTTQRSKVIEPQAISLAGGCITNDANHISAPSRTGEGLRRAITGALLEAGIKAEDISFVNPHGTATLYNDEMEAKAVTSAGLACAPLNSLKPFWGHTLGASGIIETIACMHELTSDECFGTPGFHSLGVASPLNLCETTRKIDMRRCLKTASGFGGCNAAIVLEKEEFLSSPLLPKPIQTEVVGCCRIEKDEKEPFATFIREQYKASGEDYRKFYKMDDLSKLAYISTTKLLKEHSLTKYKPEEIGLFLANRSSSLDTDLRHQQIIDSEGDEAASPAVFVYTLSNVMLGEICIRYGITGDNTCFIFPEEPGTFLRSYAEEAMCHQKMKAAIIGWCELNGKSYESHFQIIERKTDI